MSTVKQPREPLYFVLPDDGVFPNSPLPVVIYQNAAGDRPSGELAAWFAETFTTNRWLDPWQAGLYPYHHYHSTACEVLGVVSGTGRLVLGGPHGITTQVHPGDVIAIPPGVAHANPDGGLTVVGAYFEGCVPDLCTGKPGERPDADERISSVMPADVDPIQGVDGPLTRLWA